MSPVTATQEGRLIALTTPLGKDVLLLKGFTGHEGISELFSFQLNALAENKRDVPFEKLLGQKATVMMQLPKNGKKRYISGIISKVGEVGRDQDFTAYRLELVPQLWLLTKRMQSRIFQHLSVVDILKKVFDGLDVAYELQGRYPVLNYCVQYEETDFNFASRMMEEEGIFYYFKHTADGHQLVLADKPQAHPDMPEQAQVIYDPIKGGKREDDRVTAWQKEQELTSGKYTLWDYCFEMPQKRLESDKIILDGVTAGKVQHKLKTGGNDKLEIFHYPGEYAHRFDGIDRGGGAQPGELQKIFEDNKRTAEIRMQQEAVQALRIDGGSSCRQFVSGYKFTLERHYNADGQYVMMSVDHTAKLSADYRSGEGEELAYNNTFTCIPIGLPFRPPRHAFRPVIAGSQTATVVGPPGELMYPDKYGRVKVKFHWDRHGKPNLDSSCWVRVSQNWGGANWGGMFIPHVGQEVIVAFLEGDPDQPLITGRVYNAEQMPPMELPANKTKSALTDHGGNKMIMEGHNGVQQIMIHSPHSNSFITLGNKRNPPEGVSVTTDAFFTMYCMKDSKETINGKSESYVRGNSYSVVDGSAYTTTKGLNQTEVFGDYVTLVHGSNKTEIGGKSFYKVIGPDTQVNIANKNEILLAATSKLHVGVKIEVDAAKDLGKTPFAQKKIGKLELMAAKVVEKMADRAQKVAGRLKTEAADVESIFGNDTQKVKGMIKYSASELRTKASKWEAVASKIKSKAASIELDGKTKIAGGAITATP